MKSNGNSVTPKATAQDVETVIPSVLERGGEYFRELWKSLSDRDRNLLRCLIQGETPAQQDKAVLRKLERKEILPNTESVYRIQVPLAQNYVETGARRGRLSNASPASTTRRKCVSPGFVTKYKEEK